MILVNGKPDKRINVSDRGLQYGDGLFETIAYRNGQFEFLEAHLARLISGCQRLSIPFRQGDQLREELTSITADLAEDDAVIKIIVTRGAGGRGYYADTTCFPTRIISTHPMPCYPDSYSEQGINAIFCQQHLSENSSLAGLKHLNRLEQVLARNEWHDTAIAEGIMCDQHDRVIEGTMSNLFIVKSDALLTAIIDKSGVAGIIRAEIIASAKQQSINVKETRLSKEMLFNADEVFVCNSIIGVWPVKTIIDQEMHYNYQTGTLTRHFQQQLADKI